MKHKVAELEGALLDAAVAKAEDVILVWENFERLDYSAINEIDGRNYRPSVDWRIGGKIVERERIMLLPYAGIVMVEWSAHLGEVSDYVDTRLPLDQRYSDLLGMSGPTPLIAAMRAYLSSRFGEEVELP